MGLLHLLIGPLDILLLSVPRVHHTNPQQSVTFRSKAARGCHAIKVSSSRCQILFPMLVNTLLVPGKIGSRDANSACRAVFDPETDTDSTGTAH